jgi:hypothetical protein
MVVIEDAGSLLEVDSVEGEEEGPLFRLLRQHHNCNWRLVCRRIPQLLTIVQLPLLIVMRLFWLLYMFRLYSRLSLT